MYLFENVIIKNESSTTSHKKVIPSFQKWYIMKMQDFMKWIMTQNVIIGH